MLFTLEDAKYKNISLSFFSTQFSSIFLGDLAKKLFGNLRKRLSRRRLLLKKAERSSAGASDVKKAKDDR